MIVVKNLSKEFLVIKKSPGFSGALKSIFFPDKKIVHAIDNVSFSINRGEIVGYIGPNGAGKSTTVKILCGILHPTSGTILINGLDPQKKRQEIVRNIGTVFGQRTQLYWDIRLGESFELLRRIYRIDNETYNHNLSVMNEMLQINELIDIPVRQLSLGQRMRGDLVAAFLHSPKIIFLDEPTIGLDIQGKKSIRKFIKNINRLNKATIILTTHDLDDVEELCNRLIIINKGRIVEDGGLKQIINKITPYRLLIVDAEKIPVNFKTENCEIVKSELNRIHLKFDKNKITASQLIAQISLQIKIVDLSVKESDIEDVIENIYGQSV